jgi:glycerol-3-phosphate dehydrogenase
MHAAEFDVIVIGGGINGAGIARDAAGRGLRTCLIEQGDLGSGTTRFSSRLIHGGLRYLEHGELGLVYESLREREALLTCAPHLVRPLPLAIPIYRGGRRGRWTIAAGMWLYDLLSAGKSVPRHRMLSREQALRMLPGLNPAGLIGAASYYDAQVTFAERLVVEIALAARSAGADIRTYCRVDRILTRHRRVQGVEYTDTMRGGRFTVTAPLVVNAAGPWVDRVLLGLDRPMRKILGGSRGTHIVVHRFPDAPTMACYVEARADGRPFFVIPWNGMLLIGTTDIRFDGDPAAVRAQPRELRYLIDETNRVFPGAGLKTCQILYTYAGVRPLPRKRRKEAAAISRRHFIKHHRRFARGLYSVIGGKLTTYRHLAEDVVDRLWRSLHLPERPCTTATEPLPGARLDLQEVEGRLCDCGLISPESRRHLLEVYGCRAGEILQLVNRDGDLAASLCPYSHAIAAEIVFACEAEMAVSLADCLQRRCMAGLAPDLGRAALPQAAAVTRRHLGWSAGRIEAEVEAYLKSLENFQPPRRTG